MKFTPTPVRCALASPWGPMTLAANDTALVWAGFDGQRYETDLQHWPVDATHPVLRQTVEQLQQYFAGARQTFDVPLDLGCGTAFQQRVWQALLAIAPGSTSTYGAVSQHIGQPSAVRAVGGAIGRNPISILVPCHRVLGAQGALTGYSGGMDRKIALLQLEGCL
ncbi:MAG: methylated-DNA--[protein]-cysteine S-methyltransferase [Rhodoferax sp.]